MTRILRIDSSARHAGSYTRDLLDAYVATTPGATVVERDVSEGLPVVTADWVAGAYTPEADRTPDQRAALALSDELIAEVKDADVLLIGQPIYNFGVPAALKLWMDQVARAGVTFRYTETGPQGLLEGKRAVIVVASGGTEANGPQDFATPHLVHFLGFIGISDVEIYTADQLMLAGEGKVEAVRERIAAHAA